MIMILMVSEKGIVKLVVEEGEHSKVQKKNLFPFLAFTLLPLDLAFIHIGSPNFCTLPLFTSKYIEMEVKH